MPSYYDEKRKTWYCKFYYKDYTGQKKQKCKRGFPRKTDAAAYERDFLLNMADSPDITFKALRKAYDEYCSTRLKSSTLRAKESMIRNNIAPYFDNKQITEITTRDVSKWQDTIKAKGFKPTSLRQINGQLTAIFNFAVKYKGLSRNPCIEPIGSTARDSASIVFWTLDEYNAFIDHVPDIAYKTIYDILYYTGCRIGELMALTLSDVDFRQNTISISKTLDYHIKKDNIGTPKTQNSIRTIVLPEQIIAELKEYTMHVYDLTPHNALFFFSYDQISAYKNRICEQYSLKKIRLHDFRHSHVSLLVNMGTDIYLIAERIGDDVQTVQRTYAHLYPNKQHALADRLNILVSQ